MSIQIETDLKGFVLKFEQRFDKFDQKLDKLSEEITELKVGQAEIKGDIKTLNPQVEGLEKRTGQQEFTNRGIFVALIVAILGSAMKLFGIIGNP